MQSYNETADLSSIRAQIVERIGDNLTDLAIRAGFRRSRQKGRLGCLHGRDVNPSARVYRGRVKCFACGGSWSAIDLTILAHGCHYVEALRLLATETGIPWHNLTRGEHERIGIASRRARDIAVDVADWSHGLRLWAEQRKARLVDLAHEWWISGADEMGDTVAGMITTIPRAALDPESADPRLLVAAYLRATRECPKSAAEILRSGREDRAQAESITSAIIQMLARTQDRTMAA